MLKNKWEVCDELKEQADGILYNFCYCQQIQEKDHNQQYVCPTFSTL